jgi:hypothetical protein
VTIFKLDACMGTATRQTARGCGGSPWPQSGAERWNYRQSDGEDDRKRGSAVMTRASAPWVASATSSSTFWACFSLWWFILPGSKIGMEPNMFSARVQDHRPHLDCGAKLRLASLGRNRRLSKDYEYSVHSSERDRSEYPGSRSQPRCYLHRKHR